MSLWCHADKLTETEMDQNLKLYSTTVTTRSKDEHPVVSCWGVHEGIRVSTHSIGLTLPCTARATTCQDVIKKGRHVAMELQEFDRFSRGSSQFLRIRCFLCIWIFTCCSILVEETRAGLWNDTHSLFTLTQQRMSNNHMHACDLDISRFDQICV